MFSYLSTVQKLIDRPVFDRGMVSYLQGSVGGFSDLTLDYWREYTFSGSEEYHIKIPLMHLALDPQKFDSASDVISELVTCTCPYFLEYGICKHIVAVCASLDKEFSLEQAQRKTKIAQKEGDKILNQIFEAETTRTIREFNANLEMYLSSSKTTDFRWLDNFVIAVNDDYSSYQITMENLDKVVTRSLRNYDLENKIIKILSKSLIFGNKIWWDFWKPHLSEIHQNNFLRVWAEIWEMRVLNLLTGFSAEADAALVELDTKQKESLLNLLQANFKHNTPYWLDFVFVSKYYEWIEANLLNLDPKTLIQATTVWPDKVEEIEPHILEKIKIWLDFLQPGDYDELVETFHLWLKTLGGGEYYQQALIYVKETHKTKRSLINRILKMQSVS